jgi:hypothetical protein
MKTTHVVAFLHSPTRAKSKPYPCWPRSTLEEKDGKYDAEGETKTRSDEEGGDAAIPLGIDFRSVRIPIACGLRDFRAVET